MKFFVCEHCGNLVGVIHDAGVPMMCCGQKMTQLIPGTVEASVEKHLPVVPDFECAVVRLVVPESRRSRLYCHLESVLAPTVAEYEES